MENSLKAAPQAKKIDHPMEKHGDVRHDPYYWLNQREDEEVIKYLKDENDYLKQGLHHTEELQERLFNEIKSRIKEDDSSVPYFKNHYWYYVRFAAGKEHPIYCRKKESLEAEEEIILDANLEAEHHSFYQVGGLSVSPDNRWLAYAEDTLSRRLYNIRIRNLQTGETLPDLIPETTGGVAWANDSRTFFYTLKDETLRPSRIMKHRLEDPSGQDEMVYEEKDLSFTCQAYRSKSGAFVMIACGSSISNEYHFLDANTPDADFRVMEPRQRDLEYSVAHYEDHWYIHTNADGAKNFKLVKAPLMHPGKSHWRQVIPHREKVLLENVEIFSDYLVTEERERGLTRIFIQPWDGSEAHYISFPEETYTAGIGNNPEFNTTTLRYGYSSMTTPASVIDYRMDTHESKLMKRHEVVGGHDPDRYQAERIWAEAPDGKQVPVSLVYRKDLKRPEGNPLLLYGYGSYGITVDPGFSSVRLSLLDRGFVYAIAHIRGGQYLGRAWYEDGKMLNKKNSFSDFIACGESLLEKKYAAADHLYAMGGSAGGLLMGTVINWRPDLFRGIIAAVPFVDVVTTMLDESIPLTTGEYDEWGNPNDPEYYEYIKSYSPYDNVKAQDYPAMLVTTGLHDSQVQYWEPAKWVARLREVKTDKNPLYLYCNMETGHSGASGRFEVFRETAMEYAFLLDLEGIGE